MKQLKCYGITVGYTPQS